MHPQSWTLSTCQLLPVPLLLGRTVAPGVLLPLGVRLDLSRKTSKPWEVKNIPKNFEDEIARKLTWNLVHRDFVHVHIALVMASTDHLEKGISGVLSPVWLQVCGRYGESPVLEKILRTALTLKTPKSLSSLNGHPERWTKSGKPVPLVGKQWKTSCT